MRARKEAWSVVQAAKVTFCRRYYGLYCQVVQIVGDPALAMTYFRRVRKSSASQDSPDLSEPPLAATSTEVEPAQAA